MNGGAFGENYPYSNFHDLNLDWIIKIAKDFLDQYTHIQETIANGEESLQTKADALEAALQQWYNTHSTDIANKLTAAIRAFNLAANNKAEETIASIPDDYTELSNKVLNLNSLTLNREGTNYFYPLNILKDRAINSSGIPIESPGVDTTDFLPIDGGYNYVGSLYGFTHMFQVIAWYDSNKEFIARVTSTARATIPDNATYVRFTSNFSDNGFIEGLQFQKGYAPTNYVGYYDIENVSQLLDLANRILFTTIPQYNFLENNYDLFISRFTIDGSLNWAVTDQNKAIVIPIYGNSDIKITAGNNATVIAFLRNKYRMTHAADVCYARDSEGNIIYDGDNPVPDPNARKYIVENSTAIYKAPEEARYLYILWESGTSQDDVISRMPDFLSINEKVSINKLTNKNKDDIYHTIFFDDFNEFNTDIWKTTDFQSPGYYSRFKTTPNNTYIDNSTLVLRCMTENGITAGSYISTCDTFAVKKGRASARIKLSTNGTGSYGRGWCWWLFGQGNKWPIPYEFDVIEQICNESTASVNTHKANNNDADAPIHITVPQLDATQWHTYTVEWDEKSLIYYIDDTVIDYYLASALQSPYTMNFPMDLRFNVKYKSNPGNENFAMYIDWVKVESKETGYIPTQTIGFENLSMNVGDVHYIIPTETPSNASNFALTITSSNPTIVEVHQYENDIQNQFVLNRIDAKTNGQATITLTTPTGKITGTFTVTVS